jgi:hypothetical protein
MKDQGSRTFQPDLIEWEAGMTYHSSEAIATNRSELPLEFKASEGEECSPRTAQQSRK